MGRADNKRDAHLGALGHVEEDGRGDDGVRHDARLVATHGQRERAAGFNVRAQAVIAAEVQGGVVWDTRELRCASSRLKRERDVLCRARLAGDVDGAWRVARGFEEDAVGARQDRDPDWVTPRTPYSRRSTNTCAPGGSVVMVSTATRASTARCRLAASARCGASSGAVAR